jgi:hypothetical protein
MTELFVAREDIAKAYDRKRGPSMQCVKLGGLTSLEFETLWAIVGGEEWSAQTHALEPIASTDGTWTFRFPQVYLDKLKALDAASISKAATAWAATDEIKGKPEVLESVILKVATLSRSFADRRLAMYLWFSL